MSADVRPDETGVGVHLSRQQPQPQQLFVDQLEYLTEPLVAYAFNEVADCGVTEPLVVYGQEAEPANGNVLRDCRAQPPEKVILYSEEMSRDLTSTSGWIAGLPISRQQ